MSTDIELRRRFPGHLGVGTVRGDRHRLTAHVRTMERRREIVAVGRREVQPGVLEYRYVRLKSLERVRRETVLRWTAVAAGTLPVLGGVGWLVWESRQVLMLLALGLLAGAGLLYLSLHWKNGCSGIHCSGCRG